MPAAVGELKRVTKISRACAGDLSRHRARGMPAHLEPGPRVRRNSFPLFQSKFKRSTTMGIFTKDIKTMEDMFLHQLEDIYYA